MNPKSLGVVFALLLAAAQASRAQELSSAEKKLTQSVEARLGEEMAALEKVVNIDSGTFNTEGVREVGRFFEKELQALGFKARWIPMPEAMHRAGHLVAERISSKPSGKRVLLIGHLDTVFEGQGHRFQNDGAVIRGAGVMDMKGGDVVLLFALKALDSAGLLKGATVRVFLTGDEENPGLPTSESRRDVVAAARESDVALSFEPALATSAAALLLGRRGLSTWSLDVTAPGGHSAFVLRPRSGTGAIYEASRILDGFRAAFSSGNVTVNPGLFLGGTDVAYDPAKSAGTSAGKYNVVSRSATVKGDLRALEEKEREAAKGRMREIVAASLPKAAAKLEFDDLVPPFPVTEGNRALMQVVNAAGRALGQATLTERDPVASGFGDANFVCSLVSAVDGLGVAGDGLHSPDEIADPKSVGPMTARAAVAIARLLSTPN
ncbi:MAG: M20/M25/M40 family metallo-hydrolase [Acidobacteriota bacterium]|nr:M20/M25/M40 family metallo-hydrolase [Acidobacteriota bacterium]